MTRTITKSNGKWYTVTPRSGFGEACSGGWLEGVTTPEPGDRVMVEYDAMGSYPLPALPDGLKYDNGIVVVKQDEMSKKIHLTLTGYYAGAPLCGCNKEQEMKDGNEFTHAIYFNENDPNQIARVCKDCYRLWTEAEG